MANFNVNTTESNVHLDERPYVKVSIFNKTYTALIDTGAMLTFISDDVANHLKRNNVQSTDPKIKVHLANRSLAVVKDSYKFPMLLCDQTYLIDAIHVSKLSTSVILGMDLLKRLSVVEVKIPTLKSESKDTSLESSISEISTLTPEEKTTLQCFLKEELTQF